MLFFKKKNVASAVVEFVKKADNKLMDAYHVNDIRELKGFFNKDTMIKINRDMTGRKAAHDEKFINPSYMDRTYTVIEENEDVCVVRRDVAYKSYKTRSTTNYKAGEDFSEIFTVNKKDGMSITNIVMA